MSFSSCWAADFETTTDSSDCRVWAFSVCNIENPTIFHWGKTIDEFFEFIRLHDAENLKIWYHNLKFDGFFLISYLFSQGFEWIESVKQRRDNTFTTLITDMGQYYSITVFFKIKGHHTYKVTFYDSLKIFPNFSVEKVAEGFNLPIRKLEIDYDKYRPVGYDLDEQEIAYIRNDVEIMARALKFMFEKGQTKMTIASDAMNDYKHRIRGFRKKFPLLPDEVDAEIRKSYRGGFTWVNDVWKEKYVGAGITLDVNSLYPSVMKQQPMPCGYPQYFEGEYQYDPKYPLFVQNFTCKFALKKGKIPSIQLKHCTNFANNEYVKSSKGEKIDLVLTSPDYDLFRQQYDVEDIKFNGGWKFMGMVGLFDDYINHWMEEKIKAGKEHNAPQRQLSKLMLNSLYGRYGISSNAIVKVPYLAENGVVKFYTLEGIPRKTCYIPVAAFVTSYGRRQTILSSQAIRDYTLKKYGEDRYYYSDTDSISASLTPEDLEELKDVVPVDPYEIGKWDQENSFSRALFIRQKCYVKEIDGKVDVTVAGLPKYLAPLINFDNFKRGFSTAGLSMKDMVRMAKENGASDEEIKKLHHKLTYKYVKGGVILEDTDFTIK